MHLNALIAQHPCTLVKGELSSHDSNKTKSNLETFDLRCFQHTCVNDFFLNFFFNFFMISLLSYENVTFSAFFIVFTAFSIFSILWSTCYLEQSLHLQYSSITIKYTAAFLVLDKPSSYRANLLFHSSLTTDCRLNLLGTPKYHMKSRSE